MSKKIKLTDQEQSIIESALNAYWNDAAIQLQNGGRYTPVGKMPLGDIEKQQLEQRKELVMPLLRRFEQMY